MGVIRALCRLVALVALLFAGLAIVMTRFRFLEQSGRDAWVERWSRWLLAVCGMRLRVHGRPPPPGSGALVVANHLSWIDIFVIDALFAARFVAKSEIAHWPVIGLLVSSVGTLFIERGRRHAVQHMLHTVASHLEAGERVAVFPEGTTSDGRRLLPFHGNLIQAAIVTCSPVIPVALGFFDLQGRRSDAPLFVGDTTLVTSVWRILSAPGIEAHVHLLEPIETSHALRRSDVAAEARRRISSALDLELEDRRPEILGGRPAVLR